MTENELAIQQIKFMIRSGICVTTIDKKALDIALYTLETELPKVQKENEELKNNPKYILNVPEMEAKDKEIAKLREALEKIAGVSPLYREGTMRNIAKSALDRKEE